MVKLLTGFILLFYTSFVFSQNIKNQFKHTCWTGDLLITIFSEKSKEEACSEYGMKTERPTVKFVKKELNFYFHNCWDGGTLMKITSEIADHDKACKTEGFSSTLEIKQKPFKLKEKDFKIEYRHTCFPNPQLFPENSGKNKSNSFTVYSKSPNKIDVCLSEFKKRKLVDELTSVDLKKICLVDSKTSECFSDYANKLKKLGCDYEEIECESNNLIDPTGPDVMSCAYVSKKCYSSSNKSCSTGFNSRSLDTTQKETVCVKSPERFENKEGGVIEPLRERAR